MLTIGIILLIVGIVLQVVLWRGNLNPQPALLVIILSVGSLGLGAAFVAIHILGAGK